MVLNNRTKDLKKGQKWKSAKVSASLEECRNILRSASLLGASGPANKIAEAQQTAKNTKADIG